MGGYIARHSRDEVTVIVRRRTALLTLKQQLRRVGNAHGEGHVAGDCDSLQKLRSSVIHLQGAAFGRIMCETRRGPQASVTPSPGQRFECSLGDPEQRTQISPAGLLTLRNCAIISNCNICGNLLCSNRKVMQCASRGWMIFM